MQIVVNHETETATVDSVEIFQNSTTMEYTAKAPTFMSEEEALAVANELVRELDPDAELAPFSDKASQGIVNGIGPVMDWSLVESTGKYVGTPKQTSHGYAVTARLFGPKRHLAVRKANRPEGWVNA